MSGFHHCDKAFKKIYLKEKRLILPMGSEFSVHGHLVVLFLGLWGKQSIKACCRAKTGQEADKEREGTRDSEERLITKIPFKGITPETHLLQ